MISVYLYNKQGDDMNFQEHLPSIIAHAKQINFDVENGDFMELMKSWLEAGRKTMIFIEDNKELFIKKLMKMV